MVADSVEESVAAAARCCSTLDRVQPKKSLFPTHKPTLSEIPSCKLILLTYFLSFSYLNTAQDISVIELCREPIFLIFCFTVL